MTREQQIMQACEQLTESLSQFERQCFIAGAEWADKHQPSLWISVEDRLPERECIEKGIWGAEVLCKTDKNLNICARLRENGEWEDLGKKTNTEFLLGKITHWMPIPELKEIAD